MNYECEKNNSKRGKSSHRVDKSNVKKKGNDGIGLLDALAHINSWIVDSGATCQSYHTIY